jgi:hypothetical protein
MVMGMERFIHSESDGLAKCFLRKCVAKKRSRFFLTLRLPGKTLFFRKSSLFFVFVMENEWLEGLRAGADGTCRRFCFSAGLDAKIDSAKFACCWAS